jgi:hypothetical protein
MGAGALTSGDSDIPCVAGVGGNVTDSTDEMLCANATVHMETAERVRKIFFMVLAFTALL